MCIIILTYYVSPHSTDEIKNSYSQPADGSLNLDANVQLDGDDDDNVNDTQVDEGRREPTPKLLSCRSGWITILRSNTNTIEPTYVTKTVDLSV